MNADHEIDRLLEQSGAVLVRQNKHLVYRLPNGRNFIAAKTSSDPERAAKNSLSDLRRALGIGHTHPRRQREEASMQVEAAALPEVPAAQQVPEEESLNDRIMAAIARGEGQQAKLLAEAEAVERRVQMLKALLPFAGDAAAEDALRAILPPVAAPEPATVPPPAPPERITERVQVTRQLVLAATQTFEDTFTVNDVLSLMTGGREIDSAERVRVRSAVAQAMVSLHDRGELIREAAGYGRRQAVWRKATLEANGTRA